ncbi:MAG: hypothetical protein JEZ14_24555, partial [Marinilabiliaceae bacterium]|nr:hypothetical protein [Marinilabiliaceae bacterium]
VNKVAIEGLTKDVLDVVKPSMVSLNDSIGIMLRSYTRAINKQEGRSGALFRRKTKAACLTQPGEKVKKWYISQGVTFLNVDVHELQYPAICYQYIINNPVKAGLVKQPSDWEFSSAKDVLGYRKGKLINRSLINEYDLKA